MGINNLIDKETLQNHLDNSPAERVTAEDIDARIVNIVYNFVGTTATLCSITLDNGFVVHGESACVNPANFNAEVGKKIAYENAYDKLWAFFGFALAEKNFNKS